VAGLGLIRVAVTKADTSSYLIVQGLTRVELAETVQRRPYRVQRIRPMPTLVHDPTHLTALTAKLRDLVAERLNQGQSPSHTLFKSIFALKGQPTLDALAAQSLQYFLKYLEQLDDPSQIADLVSCTLLPNAQERQAILETAELESRLHQVIQFLRAEIHRQKTA
jgi:ATP-dependent Lon protease